MSNRTQRTLQFIAIIVLIAQSRNLQAQHVGFSAARTKSDIVTSYRNEPGRSSHPDRSAFSAGLTYRQPLRSRVMLQTELQWVPKGYSRESTPTLTLNYLEIPVLLRVGALAPTGAALSPVLSFGPTIAILATCRLQGISALTKQERCQQVLIGSTSRDYRMQRIDAGLMLGAGAERRTRDGTILGIEARYDYGLLDINRNPGTSSNRTISLVVNFVPSRLY